MENLSQYRKSQLRFELALCSFICEPSSFGLGFYEYFFMLKVFQLKETEGHTRNKNEKQHRKLCT
jgi:hypothetical protein